MDGLEPSASAFRELFRCLLPLYPVSDLPLSYTTKWWARLDSNQGLSEEGRFTVSCNSRYATRPNTYKKIAFRLRVELVISVNGPVARLPFDIQVNVLH